MGGHLSRTSEDSDEEAQVLKEDPLGGLAHTEVPAHLFETPEPISMSGGTAAFYKLRYCGPSSGPDAEKYDKSPTYWLGKDVARALDELPFYEDIRELPPNKYPLLTNWTMTYEGILTKPVQTKKGIKNTSLLVIHDIADGLTRKRMLDIKLGQETAVANWQGKSALAAERQRMTVDRFTNSSDQGFRLEGFDYPPNSLETQDFGGQGACKCIDNCLPKKKYYRLSLQRMTAREFLRYFSDFNDMQDIQTSSSLEPIEYSEAILFDAARQLGSLCADAMKMPVPQMWIGSSLCLACDDRRLPERQATLQRLAHPRGQGPSMQPGDIAKVCVFDWGRSELDTIEKYNGLDSDGKELRNKYWIQWRRGLLRCLFEVVNLYLSQFMVSGVNPKEGAVVTISAWDYDTYDPSDYLGSCELPLEPTEDELEVELENEYGTSCGFVTVTISQHQPPSNSRLREIWSVHVHRVEDLPKADLFSDTDPMVRIEIGPSRKIDSNWYLIGMRASQHTPVVYDDRNAEIEHCMVFGVVQPNLVEQLTSKISADMGGNLTANDFRDHNVDEYATSASARRLRDFEDFLLKIPGGADLIQDDEDGD